MRKINLNGVLLIPALCLLYVGVSVYVLLILAKESKIAEGIEGADIDKLMDLTMATGLLVGGVLIYVPILYLLGEHLSKPAPKWLYLVLPFVMMGMIFLIAPSPAGR